jgi:hypothetical protein
MHATPLTTPITIRLQQGDFDVPREIHALTHGRVDVGAVVSFSGVCRGGAIIALTLEHYPGMADAESWRGWRPTGSSLSCVGLAIGRLMFANRPPFGLSQLQVFGGV